MTLLQQSERVSSLGEYATIAEIARLKGTTYGAVRMYLRRNPDIPIMRIGNVVLVERSRVVSYVPRGAERVLEVQ